MPWRFENISHGTNLPAARPIRLCLHEARQDNPNPTLCITFEGSRIFPTCGIRIKIISGDTSTIYKQKLRSISIHLKQMEALLVSIITRDWLSIAFSLFLFIFLDFLLFFKPPPQL